MQCFREFMLSSFCIEIMWYRVQFGINLNEWDFKEFEIARAFRRVKFKLLEMLRVQMYSKLYEKTIWFPINNMLEKFEKSIEFLLC